VSNLAELILQMLPDEPANAVMGCDISTSEEAVRRYMELDDVAVCTDGFHQPWLAPCHPRSYGAFPRVLGSYVREKRVISLDQALRKMPVVPARAMGLADRGALRAGACADVVMFDPVTIADQATFTSPAAPDGIELVLVNGEPMVDRRGARDGDGFLAGPGQGRLHGRLPGRVLRGPGYRRT
jgi:N-acyl-D-amino-acid deacylase